MAEKGSYSLKTGAAKEILNLQQQLLHKLYTELDQEREASKSAASETLFKIHQLQLQKAAIELEAKQYKRMSEEKLFHANECLKKFEDVIRQKDLEIASLRCQIQAFKFKLLSLSFNHGNCGETERFESEEVYMNITLPVDCNGFINVTENESLFDENRRTDVHQDLKVQEIGSSYWQQIKKLDQIVKGISKENEFGRRNGFNFVEKRLQNLLETNTVVDSVCSIVVQDIFEVPEVCLTDNDERKVESESFYEYEKSCESIERKILEHYISAATSEIRNAGSRSEMKRLSNRIERIEHESNGVNSRQEISVIGVQELALLKETLNKIQTQLSKVQTDIKSLKTSKTKKHDDSVLRILEEEILHFWL